MHVLVGKYIESYLNGIMNDFGQESTLKSSYTLPFTVLELLVDMLVKLVFNEFWLRLYKMLSIWLRLLQYVLYQKFLDLFIFWLRLCENCTEISENNYLDVLPVTGIGINFYSCKITLCVLCVIRYTIYDTNYDTKYETLQGENDEK